MTETVSNDSNAMPDGSPQPATSPMSALGSGSMPSAGKEGRQRPKPGERRLQILQTLATMLESPQGDRVTTAALAAHLKVSEAALYRHFASKAQMYEGLIEFIETSLFSLVNHIQSTVPSGQAQARAILDVLLGFAERNPGMTRVLVGDALVHEDDRLTDRINQVLDRLEASLRQSFRIAASADELAGASDANVRANLALCYVLGRWSRFARTGFKRSPCADAEQQIALLVA